MRVLVVEDEFTSRKILQRIFSSHGTCDTAVNGNEAVEAFEQAWLEGEPYDLICMDVLLPNMDGHQALEAIRNLEKEMGIMVTQEVHVMMVTILDDTENIMKAFFKLGASSYIVKPVKPADREKVIGEVRKMGLLT
ncbi:MAG: response regulator [Desulfobacterales bacterium]|nr:response regulator [Desulfobacterales bacterium]